MKAGCARSLQIETKEKLLQNTRRNITHWEITESVKFSFLPAFVVEVHETRIVAALRLEFPVIQCFISTTAKQRKFVPFVSHVPGRFTNSQNFLI